MAKNCYKCTLPISNEQPFVSCKSCNNSLLHISCIKSTDKVEDYDAETKLWKCSSCSAKDFKGTSNSFVTKLDDLLLKITKLQDEQKGIVNSIINACNDTMGNYEETINNVTGLLTSLQSELDDFTEEQIESEIEGVVPQNEEQLASSKW